MKAILRFLNPSHQDRVLEVGCGAGNVLEQIPSNELYGIDLSASLLEKSQGRLAHRHAKLVRANAERLPSAKRQFRKLVCTEVLEHVPGPRKIVGEMARVATAEAVLVISVPNEGWINWAKGSIHALGLGRWLLGGDKDSYSSPDCMTDEWHLPSFDLAFLREIITDVLFINQIQAIPFDLIPLRYVVKCAIICS